MIRERRYGNPTNTTSGPSALLLKGELWGRVKKSILEKKSIDNK